MSKFSEAQGALDPETIDALLDHLEWLVNLVNGVGKAGGRPEAGEMAQAVEESKLALRKARGED